MSRRRSQGRNIHGVLLLDKPIGITSNDALQQAKRLFKARKAGHTGSLDKLATGLLPLCFGHATKVASFLLDADKRYHAVCQLGQTTETGDAEGEITSSRPVEHIQCADVEQILTQFLGSQEQIPPMYSALKRDGKKLYELARQGITVEREARPIEIYSLELMDFHEGSMTLDVSCSKGTYIRTLAEDIGEALGCGAHVSSLRRVSVGLLQDMISFETLENLAQAGFEQLDQTLMPIEDSLPDWPTVEVAGDMAYYMRQGQSMQVPQAPTEGWVRLFDKDTGFMGIGHILPDGRVAPKRLLIN
ncbi:MAG: tRNA pseudouridine(55) synthase TruB [Pseudomonadota bacterium]